MARASGVGPKLAVRIIIELKGKPITGVDLAATPADKAEAPVLAAPSAVGEAVAALMGLGANEVNARRVVEHAALRLGDEADVSALIKAGLQELGR